VAADLLERLLVDTGPAADAGLERQQSHQG
jgi:hypothetical protein